MRAKLTKAVSELEARLAEAQALSLRHALVSKSKSVSYESWADYALSRGINDWLHQGGGEEKELRQRVLSKLLSYPLTLARNLNHNAFNLEYKDSLEIHVVGARAEATLPPIYWNEIFTTGYPAKTVNLVFIGPQVNVALDGKQKLFGDCLQMEFRRKLYEETSLSTPDVFYLCNSGIGNEFENGYWQKTFQQKLLNSNSVGLFTSFNKSDFEADRRAIKSLNWGKDIGFEENNPMRSLWEARDQQNNVVHSNHSSLIVSFKT
mmetsp:Transcript_22674/g.28930  ORF Transcript_22674/g.28930 Transcript_22674/m.28930 type:complete len:263 (-) Transcript_22674:32-820(-)